MIAFIFNVAMRFVIYVFSDEKSHVTCKLNGGDVDVQGALHATLLFGVAI